MTSKLRIFAVGAILGVCALPAGSAVTVNRDALRQIVQDQCLVHWLQQHSAAPCERVYLPHPPHESGGYAVLADRKGGAHFLLIPTQTISGIESPELLKDGAPNYFAAAWDARDRVAAVVGHGIRRSAVGLALNPLHARSQDQLHIHIECVRADVAAALQAAAPRVTGVWSPVAISGSEYEALRVMGEELGDSDPFKLLAERLPGARPAMSDYTLLVAGMDFTEGPGFIVLTGKGPASELLLDSACAVAAQTVAPGPSP